MICSWRDKKRSVLEYLAVYDEKTGTLSLPGVSLAVYFYLNNIYFVNFLLLSLALCLHFYYHCI